MADLRSLDPHVYPLARAFVSFLEDYYKSVTITSARRDRDQQRTLWNRFKAGLAIFPAAPPGHSPHECGLAWDMVLDPPDYETAGALWESLGYRWGGRFHDPIHFDVLPRGFVPDPTRSICEQVHAGRSR